MTMIDLPKKAQNLTGRRFGRLVVLCVDDIVKYESTTHIIWRCLCDCGSEVLVRASNLRSGNSTSCGCRKKEVLKDKATKHGMKSSPEYKSWCHIKDRCLNSKNKKWRHYGGRGITIHHGWVDDFQSFLDHIGPRPGPGHSVDRINNDGNYEPGNVRWATYTEQNRNRRRSATPASSSEVNES